MLLHSFPPCSSFPPEELPSLPCPSCQPPPYTLIIVRVVSSVYILPSCWALTAQTSYRLPCFQHPLLHLCALWVQHKLLVDPVTGLPFMPIPLSLFLTFHYIDHTHYFQYFPNKVSWTAKPHTQIFTLLHFYFTHSPYYHKTLTNFPLLFLMFPGSPL